MLKSVDQLIRLADLFASITKSRVSQRLPKVNFIITTNANVTDQELKFFLGEFDWYEKKSDSTYAVSRGSAFDITFRVDFNQQVEVAHTHDLVSGQTTVSDVPPADAVLNDVKPETPPVVETTAPDAQPHETEVPAKTEETQPVVLPATETVTAIDPIASLPQDQVQAEAKTEDPKVEADQTVTVQGTENALELTPDVSTDETPSKEEKAKKSPKKKDDAPVTPEGETVA